MTRSSEPETAGTAGGVPPDADAFDPLIGQVVAERYRVRRAIARGAMGRVYEAEQQPLGRPVAVKILDVSAIRADSTGGGDRYQERFLREASLLARLTHPNTVRIYDYGNSATDSWLVMEYVRGVTLRALVVGKPLGALRAIRIARQICGSLEEAHGLGLIHRDLKLGNVLVSDGPDGDVVKVVDFGLVKEVGDAAHMTGDGTMVGTPMYMAPEQISGRRVDQRCDLYALGVVLYALVSRRFPFPDGAPAAVWMAHLTAPPLSFEQTAPDLEVPECLAWTIFRCLEKDPDDRFRDAREVRRALDLCEAVLVDGGSDSAAHLSLADGRLVTGALPRPIPRRRRRLGAGLVAATLGFLLVLGGLAAMAVAGTGLVHGLSHFEAPTSISTAPPPLGPPTPTTARPEPEEAPEPEAAPEPVLASPVVEPPPRPVARPRPGPEPVSAPAPPSLEVPTSDLKDPW